MMDQMQLPNFGDAAEEAQNELTNGGDFNSIVERNTDNLLVELVQAVGIADAVADERTRQYQQIREVWGEALDIYMTMLVTAKEVTQWDVNRRSETEQSDSQIVVVFGMMARLLRVAFEVHELCLGGLGKAALARSRTAHELATYATLVGEDGAKGRRSHHLADRYIAYGRIQRYKDSLAYNREQHRPVGRDPFPDEQMTKFKQARDQAIEEFGPGMKAPYGWAAPLFREGHRIQFPNLEDVAGAGVMRSHYLWANHEVHADSWGAVLNQYMADGQVYLSTGRDLHGLGEPLSATMTALYKGVVALMIAAQESPTMSTILIPKTLEKSLEVLNRTVLDAEKSTTRTPAS